MLFGFLGVFFGFSWMLFDCSLTFLKLVGNSKEIVRNPWKSCEILGNPKNNSEKYVLFGGCSVYLFRVVFSGVGVLKSPTAAFFSFCPLKAR